MERSTLNPGERTTQPAHSRPVELRHFTAEFEPLYPFGELLELQEV